MKDYIHAQQIGILRIIMGSLWYNRTSTTHKAINLPFVLIRNIPQHMPLDKHDALKGNATHPQSIMKTLSQDLSFNSHKFINMRMNKLFWQVSVHPRIFTKIAKSAKWERLGRQCSVNLEGLLIALCQSERSIHLSFLSL